MPKAPTIVLVALGASLLASCGGGGVLGRERPDEFAVQRQAPLVIPPDFALVPPVPGAPRPAEGTAAQQALDALFGGPAPRSAVETSAIDRAGHDENELGHFTHQISPRIGPLPGCPAGRPVSRA